MEGLNFENTEKQKYRFTYTNSELSGHPVIFECEATDVLEADNLYRKKIGKDPDRENHISCSVVII